MPASNGLHGFRFGQFTLNISSGALLRGETELKLRPKSYEVLRILVENHGRLITKNELLDAIWGNAIVTDGSITQCLVDIRRALDDHDQKIVRTVSRRGYIFDGAVDEVREQAVGPESADGGDGKFHAVAGAGQQLDRRTNDNARDQNQKRVRGRTHRGLIVAFGAAVVLAAPIFWWLSSTPDLSGAPGIAVLPLVNAGGDPEQQFFADGLSENLIEALSKFEGLHVTGRISSFQFRDSKDDSGAIGAKLGVAYLVSGSVQRAGDTVRIHTELVSTTDGRTMWTGRYDRPYKDLFALQDEIAMAISNALHVKLLSTQQASDQDDRPPGGSIDAYNFYLQGLKHWHDQDFSRLAEYMAKAVQLDPGYARAWAYLSGAWSTVATFSNETPALAREHMRESRLAADKALQLAPGLGAAHAALAYLQFYTFDHRGAVAECRRAVQLAPRDSTVLNGCGFVLGGIGKLGDAIGLRERLLSIEPLYTVNYFQYAKLLAATGRLDEAEKYLRTSEEVARPSPLGHLRLAVLRGDATAALEIAKLASPRDRDLYMTLAAQIGPDRAVADKWLADMLADTSWVEQGGGGDNRYNIAQVYALRGDAGHTLEWLERGFAASPSSALFLLADPLLLRFRDDPQFIAFCKKLGLPSPSESEALSIDQIRAAILGKAAGKVMANAKPSQATILGNRNRSSFTPLPGPHTAFPIAGR